MAEQATMEDGKAAMAAAPPPQPPHAEPRLSEEGTWRMIADSFSLNFKVEEKVARRVKEIVETQPAAELAFVLAMSTKVSERTSAEIRSGNGCFSKSPEKAIAEVTNTYGFYLTFAINERIQETQSLLRMAVETVAAPFQLGGTEDDNRTLRQIAFVLVRALVRQLAGYEGDIWLGK